MNIFVVGSSILSSYWNGAATYYRGIYKYLARRGHRITFAEPDAYGRQEHRDPGDYSFVTSVVYKPTDSLDKLLIQASGADIVIKHSGVGVDDALLESRILELSTNSAVVFWDVDAPATIERLRSNPDDTFLSLIPNYDAIVSYGGGPYIQSAYRALGAANYFSIYNGLDPETHHPVAPDASIACDVVFLGNRLPDREARVEDLFLRAATIAPDKSFLLGGEGWGDKALPANVRWIGHVPTGSHNRVNCSAGMVVNINRTSMANVGFSPPTRVFEVAGAGTCLLCDDWLGVDSFFEPDKEIVIVRNAEDVVSALASLDLEDRARIGVALRRRALQDHTYEQRAVQVERAFQECIEKRSRTTAMVAVDTSVEAQA